MPISSIHYFSSFFITVLQSLKTIKESNSRTDKIDMKCAATLKILIVSILLLIVTLGCTESYSSPDFTSYNESHIVEELENRGYFVYQSPDEAISDIDDDTVIEELDLRGYYIYEQPEDAVSDIDTFDLTDELKYRGYDQIIFYMKSRHWKKRQVLKGQSKVKLIKDFFDFYREIQKG